MNFKNFILIICAMVSTTVFAQQRIATLQSKGEVYNYVGMKALVAAVDSAQVGDTIYLSGGVFTVPSSITKGVSIIGAGFYPDSTYATGKTVLGGNVAISGTADNFHLEGVEITGTLTLATEGDVLNNVTFIRDKINGVISGGLTSRHINGCNVIGCVLVSQFVMTYFDNVLITNNIIAADLHRSSYNHISNNVFLSAIGFTGTGYSTPLGCNYNTINNNIVLNAIITSHAHASSYNHFSNNLTISDAPAYGVSPDISPSKWEAVAIDSIFVKQDSTLYDYTHNYHLQHPEKWIGTDGEEVGIYGGMFPWKEGAIPSNPHIRKNNTAIQTDSNGMLQLDIEVMGQ